mgnify:CR=1 FL=1
MFEDRIVNFAPLINPRLELRRRSMGLGSTDRARNQLKKGKNLSEGERRRMVNVQGSNEEERKKKERKKKKRKKGIQEFHHALE